MLVHTLFTNCATSATVGVRRGSNCRRIRCRLAVFMVYYDVQVLFLSITVYGTSRFPVLLLYDSPPCYYWVLYLHAEVI